MLNIFYINHHQNKVEPT